MVKLMSSILIVASMGVKNTSLGAKIIWNGGKLLN